MAATAIKFEAGINLRRSSLLNARIQNITSDAIDTPKLDGMIWYDDNVGNKHFYGYDATAAVDFKVPRLDVAETVTGLYTFNRAGAPIAVGASSFDQLVSRFNADLLDGYHADLINNASTVAARDAGGRMQASDPVALLDVVNLGYMQGYVAGIRDPKDAARVATTTTLPANTRTGNTLTASANGSINSPGIDGETDLAVGDRILVKNEATGANNGIYAITVVGTAGTPWSMVRSTDADTSAEVTNGMQLWITDGTLNGSSGWLLTTPDVITLNTTALTFIQINSTSAILAGNGLVKVGITLHAVTSSAYTTGAIIYASGASTLAQASLTGIVQGNGASAPTAITGTTNYLPKWSASAPYLTATSLIYDSGTGVGVGTAAPQQTIDLGDGSGGRSIVWGGGGANWYDSIGTSVSVAALELVNFLKLNTAADELLFSYTATVPVAGIRIGSGGGALSGDIAFFNAAAAARTAGVVFDYVTNTKLTIKQDGNVKVHNLTASRFVQTDSNNHLSSVDLFGGTNTWTAGNTFTGAVIVQTPTADAHAATKAYVDAIGTGLRIKDPVRVATAATLPANTRSGDVLTASANGSINGTGIDGVTSLALNDRVLVKDEAVQANNGIYYVSQVGDGSNPWTLTRTTDANESTEVTKGMYTYVSAGSSNISTSWVQGLVVTTINTDSLSFNKFFQAAAYIAGTGLTLAGQTFAIDQAFSPTWTGEHHFKHTNGVNLEPYSTSGGNTTSIRFWELASNGTNYVGFKAPDAISTNRVWTLPSADGGAGDFLTSDGAGTLSFTATLAANHGGTGISSYAVGDLIYATGATTLARRAIGTSGQLLAAISGVPAWTSAYGLLLTTGTGTINYIAKWDSANSLNNSLLFDNGTNVGLNTSSPVDKFHIVIPPATTGGIIIESLDRSIVSLGLYQQSSVARDYGFSYRITAAVTDLVYSRRTANLDTDYMTVYNANGMVKFHTLSASMIVQTDSSTRLISSNSLPAGTTINGVGIPRIVVITLTGAASSYTLTHSLGTKDIQVWIRNTSTDELSLANFVAVSTTQVRIDFTFSQSSGAFVATIVG